MSQIINISEAASIAIHSMVLIAKADKLINVIKIAEEKGKEPKIKPRCSVACIIVSENFFIFLFIFFRIGEKIQKPDNSFSRN